MYKRQVGGYKEELAPVTDGDGKRGQMVVRLNSGIIVSYCISHATDAIESNPIGLEI